MKEFNAFLRKEFLHIFRDRRTLLVLIGLPTMLIVLFGFAISTEIRNVNVGLCAPDGDMTALRLMDKIDRSRYFTYVASYQSEEDIDLAMKRGEIDVALMFGEGFSSGLCSPDGSQASVIADATNPNNASMEVMYLSSIISGYFSEEFSAEMSGQTAGGLVPNMRMLYNPQLRSSYNFVPGIMGLILMLICSLMTSVSIVREKETGSMEVLLVSPVKPINIACGRKFLLDDTCVSDIHYPFSGARAFRVHSRQDPDHRNAHLRNDIPCPGDDVQRDAVSDREHARAAAVVRPDNPG